MPSYNSIIIVGHLTRDPATRSVGQTTLTEFGIASNESWTDKNGQKKEKVCFVDCKFWGKGGEVVAKYCQKGSALLVQGKLELETWEDKNGGGKRSKHVINVEHFSFLGGKSDSKPDRAPERAPSQRQERDEPAPQINGDDIPF